MPRPSRNSSPLWAPLQQERRVRSAKIVSPQGCRYRGKVTRDQPMDNKEYEEGDEERLYRLADHDDRHDVEKPAMGPEGPIAAIMTRVQAQLGSGLTLTSDWSVPWM